VIRQWMHRPHTWGRGGTYYLWQGRGLPDYDRTLSAQPTAGRSGASVGLASVAQGVLRSPVHPTVPVVVPEIPGLVGGEGVSASPARCLTCLDHGSPSLTLTLMVRAIATRRGGGSSGVACPTAGGGAGGAAGSAGGSVAVQAQAWPRHTSPLAPPILVCPEWRCQASPLIERQAVGPGAARQQERSRAEVQPADRSPHRLLPMCPPVQARQREQAARLLRTAGPALWYRGC
jgi:hypothetical protein